MKESTFWIFSLLLMKVENWRHLFIEKITHRNAILHSPSFHSDHMISNIPYGPLVRLRRICSKENYFKIKAQVMAQRFKQRGPDTKKLIEENTLTRE